jgi:hypothetical protein
MDHISLHVNAPLVYAYDRGRYCVQKVSAFKKLGARIRWDA